MSARLLRLSVSERVQEVLLDEGSWQSEALKYQGAKLTISRCAWTRQSGRKESDQTIATRLEKHCKSLREFSRGHERWAPGIPSDLAHPCHFTPNRDGAPPPSFLASAHTADDVQNERPVPLH